jgi:hypothetical protein
MKIDIISWLHPGHRTQQKRPQEHMVLIMSTIFLLSCSTGIPTSPWAPCLYVPVVVTSATRLYKCLDYGKELNACRSISDNNSWYFFGFLMTCLCTTCVSITYYICSLIRDSIYSTQMKNVIEMTVYQPREPCLTRRLGYNMSRCHTVSSFTSWYDASAFLDLLFEYQHPRMISKTRAPGMETGHLSHSDTSRQDRQLTDKRPNDD